MTREGEPRRRWRFYRAPGQLEADLPVARQEMLELGTDAVAAMADVMTRYRAGQCRPNEVKKLADGGGLIELRVQLGHDPYRLIFFHDGPVYLAVLALYKNQEKLPKKDLKRARDRMRSWQERARRGMTG